MSVVETKADERRVLRSASMLSLRGTLFYLDRPGAPIRAPRGVVESLLSKKLLVKVGESYERTAEGDAVLGIGGVR